MSNITSDADHFLYSSVRHQRRVFLFLLFKLAIIKAAQLTTTTAKFSSREDIEAETWNCTAFCLSQAQLSDVSSNVRCVNDSHDLLANDSRAGAYRFGSQVYTHPNAHSAMKFIWLHL
jgi:hypothetical protein